MSAPPEWARKALKSICDPGVLQEVEGDLEEAFYRWSEARGILFARRRYWKEVFFLAGWRVVGALRRVREGRRDQGQRTRSPLGGSGGGPGARVASDVRFALRRLVRSPLSSGIAILLLAVGIGGNATVFSVVDQVLREAPPLLQEPQELVGLDWNMGGRVGPEFGYYDYEFYRDNGEAFDDVLAYGGFPGSRGRRTDGGGGEVVVGVGDEVSQAGAWVVSGNYFRVLGVSMALGAGFSPEVQDGAEGVREVILSHGYWMRHFGGDPGILERPIHLYGVPFRVAGVTPEAFRGLNLGEPVPNLFIPILSGDVISPGFSGQLPRFAEDGSPNASRFLRLVARLRSGLTPLEAQAEAAVLQRRWNEEFTTWAETVYGQGYQLQIRSEFNMAAYESRLLRRQLFFLWFIVGAVFLIGCGNLILLLLASSADREREMGIRSSLGAGKSRVMAQLITESMVLALLGGAAGLFLAYLASGLVTATVSMNFQEGFKPDGTAILFTFLLSTLAAVLFGTVPAWKLSRVDVASLIQRPGHGRTRALFRGGLVAFQTALSVLILIVGGLLTRSLQAAQEIDLGFEPEGRLVMSLVLDNYGYSGEDGQAFVEGALARIQEIPGVRHASVMNRIPFMGSNTFPFTAPGTDFAEQGLNVRFNLVGPDYFQAMGTDILAGRAFTPDDGRAGDAVAVVSRPFADRVWPGQSSLGKTLGFGDGSVTVVGVAEHSVSGSVTENPRAFVYLPSFAHYSSRQNFIIAGEGDAAALIEPVDAAMREFNPNLAITPLRLSDLVGEQLAAFRIWSALVLSIAGAALFLALVGLYGVQASLVSRRTREIGVRMALGAQAPGIVGRVVGSGLIMGGVGALVGVGSALALSGILRGMVFGVAPNDPFTLITMPGVLLLACLAASLIPAVRASRVNPAEALREE